jgi:hypothetical protein
MPVDNTTARTCPTIESQLEDVINQIVNYDAQKLPELKTELEQVKKKKEDAVKEYRAKFEELKKRWCEQNELVLAIWRGLKCSYPDWEKWIKACVCAELTKARKEGLRVKCREEIKGRFEAARDRAKTQHDLAKDAAAAWTSAVKAISDQLNANGKLIDDIGKLAGTADRHAAIYRLWFKLLLAHARIRPETKCFDIPITEHPENLCPPEKLDSCRDCDKYEPAPKQGSQCQVPTPPDCPAAPTEWPLADPWLIDPDKYTGRIDCAYEDYLKSKKALGDAQRCFVENPDDLASVKAGRDALWKGLDAAIEKCLKDSSGKGCCEKEDEAKEPKDPDCDPCDNPKKGA